MRVLLFAHLHYVQPPSTKSQRRTSHPQPYLPKLPLSLAGRLVAMMEDLIACLYPFERSRRAIEVIEDPVNSPADRPRRVDATRQSPELQGRQSSETTAPPDDDYDDKVQPQDRGPGLELRFSHKLKGGLGIVFGTNRNSCDIVLPHLPGISRRHCYITFDDQRRLIVRDISSYGTIVTYDRKGRERRSKFKWIIGGHQVPDKTETIVVEILPNLKFQIFVSKDHLHPDLFFDNVGQFLGVATNNELAFGALGLKSAISTAAPSGRDTPQPKAYSSEARKARRRVIRGCKSCLGCQYRIGICF